MRGFCVIAGKTAFTSFNPRSADLFKHPFCNVVSVVLLEIKEHVMHQCFQTVVLHQCALMRDDFHHSALFCSKQLYLKVKKNKNKIKASFVITQKRWSVTCQERKDVINPSDRGTMHSSLQMVQTLNLLPSGEAPSLSANQKNKAP